MVKCSKCNKENKTDSEFCEYCGSPLNGSNKKKLSAGKIVLIIIIVLIVGFLLIAMFSGGSKEKTTINVTNIGLDKGSYGLYDFSCNIVPDKDYSYLETRIVFYDSEGSIIDTSPLVWNINNVKEGQSLKASGSAYVSGDNTPTKAEVQFFDKSFSSDEDNAIYKENITIG